jgi:transcription initiation factor IIE alpha subunit
VKVDVTLMIADGHSVHEVIEIEEFRLGELTDEEIESVIEIRIRSWIDQQISVAWEVQE